jgi:MOSC domain-containing protein YiiM
VVAIFITPKAAEEMVSVPQVRAFADRGLEGDRFFRDSWQALNRPDKAVSLIEAETLDAVAAELGVESLAQNSRRNIVTRGVPLVDVSEIGAWPDDQRQRVGPRQHAVDVAVAVARAELARADLTEHRAGFAAHLVGGHLLGCARML